MKKYLAVFLGTPGGTAEWNAMDPEARKQREQEGMAAWGKWMQDHGASVAEGGGPLGKTKKVSKAGIEDIRNEMGAFAVVSANSQEEAAKMFENHPHFMIFPGERVEVMEILPIPKM